MSIRIGCCLPGFPFSPEKGAEPVTEPAEILLAGYQTVMDAGYDYAESSVGMLMNLTDAEMNFLEEKKKEGKFLIESCNSFLPKDFVVTDPASLPALTDYVEEAMNRASRLGVKIIVFGSGPARKLRGDDTAKEIAAIEDFLRMCSEKGEKYDITIVIEPLYKEETNVLNSVSEASSMARKLNLPRVKVLADSFHTYSENEYLCALEENADILAHVHVAEAPDRTRPGKNGGEYLREFAKHVHGAGYDGRVSIECHMDDFAEEIRICEPLMDELFRQ